MNNTLELGLAENVGSGLMPEVINGKVDARSVHEALEVNSGFSNWWKRRIDDFGFVEGEDFFSSNLTGKHGNRMDYDVTLDMAKELAMVERNEMGRKMRRYFIECEKKLHYSAPQATGSIPTSTLMKLQEINAGVISELGQQQSRIEALENQNRPGADWLPLLTFLEARPDLCKALGIDLSSPVLRKSCSQTLRTLGAMSRAISIRKGLAMGAERPRGWRQMVRTYSPEVIQAAAERLVKINAKKGGQPA